MSRATFSAASTRLILKAPVLRPPSGCSPGARALCQIVRDLPLLPGTHPDDPEHSQGDPELEMRVYPPEVSICMRPGRALVTLAHVARESLYASRSQQP